MSCAEPRRVTNTAIDGGDDVCAPPTRTFLSLIRYSFVVPVMCQDGVVSTNSPNWQSRYALNVQISIINTKNTYRITSNKFNVPPIMIRNVFISSPYHNLISSTLHTGNVNKYHRHISQADKRIEITLKLCMVSCWCGWQLKITIGNVRVFDKSRCIPTLWVMFWRIDPCQ